ncbi:MAG TPA: DinB family protein [Candidatus Udaeobacter sp.]|nr:DinB family protein [Candidatus Udaeobacter sp.]
MKENRALREQLAKIQDWGDAHANFDAAVRDFPKSLRGRRPKGLPWSAWELIEHIRLAHTDILEFSTDSKYRERKWPEDYWPKRIAPPSDAAWQKSIRAIRRDQTAFAKLARNPKIDLFAPIPHGSGQTYMREVLLASVHLSYHVGQIVAVRRLLGCWPPK